MAEPEAFDPTHALDGWRPPAPATVSAAALEALLRVDGQPPRALLLGAEPPGFDPTRLLDGWRPPAPAPLDLELRSLLRAGSGPDEATRARLKARGYEMLDVEDIELVEAPVARVALEVGIQPPSPEPLRAEAEPPLAPASEPAVQADAAVDVALPDEEAWPVFMEEAQVIEGDAVAVEGVEMPVPEPEPEPVSSLPGEPPELDLDALPSPPAPPAPHFIDDIQLPDVEPPPAAVEAPVLEFHVAPPPEPDPEAVIAAVELPQVTPPPDVVEMPQLDIAALAPQPRIADARLLANWQAGAWTALARQVAGASEELLQTPGGLRVESHASQWLCAIWPPHAHDAPLERWPELASLVAAATRVDALQQLLAELPDEAALWSADLEADWDLVAELVLHQDTGLRSSQAMALRELAEAERQARGLRMGEGYALQGRVARRRA